jgi:sporulation protein YlmC with PRC-barrel domain
VDEEMTEQIGMLSGILIHPDTGKIEGFFVHVPRFLHADQLFLSAMDILRWGTRIVVRDADVLSPLEDRVRLQTLLSDGRTFLGQDIITDTGRRLGRCSDVQFDTMHFDIQWIWPKRFWKLQTPLPVSLISEVRKDAIIVRDPSTAVSEKTEETETSILPSLPEAA